MEKPSDRVGSKRKNVMRVGETETIVPLASLPIAYRDKLDKGYSTGWRNIDRFMQGIRKGEVTVVTADTGSGKTTFTTQLLINCALQGVPVWINSWEMRPEVTMRKLASFALKKPMKMQDFSEEDNTMFDEWCKKYKIYINPNTVGMDLAQLEAHLHEAKKMGVEIVMLDHLDYLVSWKREKLSESIDEAVKKLHELAFSLQMHFVLVCHPRQSLTQVEEVGIHGIKGSSSIKQYADNIIILHRCSRTDETADPNKVKVKIVKNRMFGIEGVTYLFYESSWDGYQSLKDEENEGTNSNIQANQKKHYGRDF